MDKEQAKFILQARRPGGEDDRNPQIVEALELAHRDPELSSWLDEELAFDRSIAAKIKEIVPPTGLKESILAGAKVIHPMVFWKRPAYVAVAACFAVLLTLTFLSNPPSLQAKPVDQFAAEYVAQLTKLNHKGESLDELKPWLGGRAVELPRGLAAVPTMGCCVGNYDGRIFSIICFKPNEDKLRPEIHLLVFDRKDLPDLPHMTDAMLAQHGDWAAACWAKDDLSYVMVRVGKKESLKQML